MKNLALIRATLVTGVALGLVICFASCTPRPHAQTAGSHPPAPQASVTPTQADTNASTPLRLGPRSLSEAEADLQQGRLTIWVPNSFVLGMPTLPAAERYHDYSWEEIKREFKADFPKVDLRFVEMDRDGIIRLMHSSPQEVHFPDVAFLDNDGEVRPLLKENAIVKMWGQSRLNAGWGGWWVVFRQARNFAAGESFLLWASQRLHWTPWSVSTNTIGSADVAAVQGLSQEAVQEFAKADAPSLESIMDPEAARFQAFGPDRIQTLLSTEPLLTFGNSRLAFVLLAAVGGGDQTFGMTHFGVVLRNAGAGWKVWLFLPNRSLPDLEKLFQSFDHLALVEAGAQAVPNLKLLAPADHAQLQLSPRPEIEWSAVDAPLATYVVESQFSERGEEYWTPSWVELVSSISVGPSVRMEAPFGVGVQPHRWRVWAISKAGIVSTSEWRVINFTGARRLAQKVSAPTEVAVAAVVPPCMEWVMAAERGQPMIAPHITIRYNSHAPGARLASAHSLTLVIASEKGIGFDSTRIPMTRAAGSTWHADFTPQRNYIPGYAIFYFEDERNTVDNHGGQYWDILNCYWGEPDPFSVGAQASTYEGRLLVPGIQRTPDLARALAILKDDLHRYPGHYVQDDFSIWTDELKLGANRPSAYEQVGRELDAFMTEHGNDSRAMRQLASFIGFQQQKLPSGVVQHYRQAVAALPDWAGPSQMNAELDYGLLWSEPDEQKKAKAYLDFAAKYPQSSYTTSAYQNALNCEVQMKDVPGAESVFEKLAALDRERLDPLFTMVQFYIDQKTRVDRAVKLLDTAESILTKDQAHYSPDLFTRERGRIALMRGQAYSLLDDLPQARKASEAAAQATPNDPKVLYALGEVREKMGDMAPALEAYLAAASAPYQLNSAPREAYERLFVAQKLGTTQDAGQKILERVAQNSNRAAAQYTPIAMNRPAPEFVFVDLAGKRFDDQAAKGKPTILTFWGVWCVPCVTELPALQEFQNHHPGANVLAVEIGNTPEEVKSFLSAHNLNTLRVAVRQDMPPEFGTGGFPNTLVIDRFGQIQFVHAGQLPDVGAILGKDLEALPAPE